MNFDGPMNSLQTTEKTPTIRRSVKDNERSGKVTVGKERNAPPKQREFEVTLRSDGRYELRLQTKKR